MRKILMVFIVVTMAGCTPQQSPALPQKIPELRESVTVIAENLNIPWALAFLPDGSMLVTERIGRVVHITQGNQQTVATIEDVQAVSEGGLLGIAVHPQFMMNRHVYVYYTYVSEGNTSFNRVVRYQYQDNQLTQPTVIVDRIPGAPNHNGGRIAFGPDGYLYIGTGDALEPSLSQNTQSLAGKILRVTDSGQPAPGNPFDTIVYSYGHRNVQGLAWDSQGRLWATEHGPRGNDEVNLIEVGANYGWPITQGDQERQGMQSPVIESGTKTWAPSGLLIYQDVLYFAGLRGSALFVFDPRNTTITTYFDGDYGRIRAAVLGPDNAIYISTSNRDGRGQLRQGDDLIIRLDPERLSQ